MLELKQSTAVEVPIGPAIAVGDGFVPVTTLTIAGADEAELIKHGATTSGGLAGSLAAYTAAVDGYYHLDLSTGETDTLGQLVIVIQDDSLILPIRHEFMVVSANYFDTKYGSDKLQVHVDEITNNIITAAAINAAALDGKGNWNIGKTGYALTTADWNVGKTGYSLTQTFPTNFSALSITAGGLGDITQAAADKVFGASGAVIPELSVAAPAATPTPRALLMLLYMALRNKLDVTSSSKKVHNDAGTQIASKVLTDDGSTYSEAEMV